MTEREPDASRSNASQIRSFEIGEETETAQGWSYDVTLIDGRGETRRVSLMLAWIDHDEISGGVVGPSNVAEGVVRVLLEWCRQNETELAARLDVSTVRRMIPDLSDRVREGL